MALFIQKAYLVFEIMSDDNVIDVLNIGQIRKLQRTNIPPLDVGYDPLKSVYLKLPIINMDFHTLNFRHMSMNFIIYILWEASV